MSGDPASPPPGARVLVHGLGRFGGGREAVRHLVRRGCRVRVADKSRDETLLAVQATFPPAADIDWQLGREDEAPPARVDVVVVGPAVPGRARDAIGLRFEGGVGAARPDGGGEQEHRRGGDPLKRAE